ncbi:MAG: alpha/beta hydrolase [Candidatus Riflebacteria bacterium]|nr:alpha/beta hydrolase [Candidatus Riflebacteria bacterium]
MLRIMTLIIMTLFALACNAEVLNSVSIRADDGYPLCVYSIAPTKNKIKGVVLTLGGSGSSSRGRVLQQYSFLLEDGLVITSFEKRGVTSDSVNQKLFAKYDEKNVRIYDSLQVMKWITQTFPKLPVVLVGESEGGEVAAEVTRHSQAVTRLILLASGSGMSQLDEFKTFIAQKGEYLGIKSLTELENMATEIKNSPVAEKQWQGHSFKRWNSYIFINPLNTLLKLNIPILALHGRLDENAPFASAQALKDAFVRMGKTNLATIYFDFGDHSFNNVKTGQSYIPEAIAKIRTWLNE